MERNVLWWVAGAALSIIAGCGPSDQPVPCTTNRECEAGEATAGMICVGGACRTCTADSECATPSRYGAGALCGPDGLCERTCAPGYPFTGCSAGA